MEWTKQNNEWTFSHSDLTLDFFCRLLAENPLDKLVYKLACRKYSNRVSADQMKEMQDHIEDAIIEIPKLING